MQLLYVRRSSLKYQCDVFSDTQDSPYQLDPSKPDTITNANFVADVPLKVIIHGYTGNKDFTPNLELRPGNTRGGSRGGGRVDCSKKKLRFEAHI